MNEIIYFILALVSGLVLGTLFFGGLWFTVKKAMTAKVPALWIIGGFTIRTGITLVGFYFVSFGNWQLILTSLLGFVVARMLVVKYTKIVEHKKMSLNMKMNHEA